MKNILGIIVFVFINLVFRCYAQDTYMDSLDQVFRERSKWKIDLINICESAFTHRKTSGSFLGYSLPPKNILTKFGRYSIYDVTPEEIVVQVKRLYDNSPSIFVEDSTGKWKIFENVCEYELDKIGALANQYRKRPESEGGGGGSFIGFTLPPQFAQTVFGRYTITSIMSKEINFKAKSVNEVETFYASYRTDGKRILQNEFLLDVKKISVIAYQYRCRPHTLGGGEGSYLGFRLPIEFDSTYYGKYWIYDVQPERIVLLVQSCGGFPYSNLYVIDSKGRENGFVYFTRNDPDMIWKSHQAIAAEIKVIAKAASEYWQRSKDSEGKRRSLKQFMIPSSLVATTGGRYTLQEVWDDSMYVCADYKNIETEYYQVDQHGNQRWLLYHEYSPRKTPTVQPKSEDAYSLYLQADSKLNEVYQQLLEKKKLDQQYIKNLKNAELLWIEYRDAQLNVKFPNQNSFADVNTLSKKMKYLTILTKKRTMELQEILAQP
jgi:uncharacterized protein YecT (DUF1311 family)